MSPIAAAVRAIVEELFPRRHFAGDYEFSVQSQTGGLVDLRPVDASLQLPSLRGIPFRGAPGIAATLNPGARVIVRFVNSDPGRPYVAGLVGEDDAGHAVVTLRVSADQSITLGDSGTQVNAGGAQAIVLRNGEAIRIVATGPVTAGPSGALDVLGTIQINQLVETAPGAPPTGFSRLWA